MLIGEIHQEKKKKAKKISNDCAIFLFKNKE